MTTELRLAIAEARRKQIDVVEGTPFLAEELDAFEQRLGVRFPADYREVALTVGALSFRTGRHHYSMFGKPSSEGIALDLLDAARSFRRKPIPGPVGVVPVAVTIDGDYGHFEFILADREGHYRTYASGGRISEPSPLVDVAGIFPFFVSMYRDDGTRFSETDLLSA